MLQCHYIFKKSCQHLNATTSAFPTKFLKGQKNTFEGNKTRGKKLIILGPAEIFRKANLGEWD